MATLHSVTVVVLSNPPKPTPRCSVSVIEDHTTGIATIAFTTGECLRFCLHFGMLLQKCHPTIGRLPSQLKGVPVIHLHIVIRPVGLKS